MLQFPFCVHKQKKQGFFVGLYKLCKRCKCHQNICVRYSVSARLEWMGLERANRKNTRINFIS